MDRTQYLGGSDVAGILGLNPWSTPLDIYYRKVGYPSDYGMGVDPQREKMLRRGKLMEPVVVKMVAAEYPLKISKRSSEKKPNRYRDKKLPFLAAEVDFEWTCTSQMMLAYPELPDLAGTQNGEVKTVHPFAARVYGEEGTDEIPIQYACQAMHGLGVTGRDACLVPVLVGSDNLRLYHVLRNEELIRVMREKCERFWWDNIVAKKEPDPVNAGDVYRILRVRNDIVVQADQALVDKVGDLIEANEAKRIATANADKCQFEVIKALVGEQAAEGETREARHVVKWGTNTILTMNKQARDTVQAKALKKAHPDIYAAYVKTTSFFVCRTTNGSK